MKFLKYILVITLLTGCAATEDIISEFDESINFDNFSTYVLCVDDLFVENTNFPRYDNNFVRELIGREVENQMRTKGHKTNVPNPELQAGFELIVQEKEATFKNCEFDEEYNYWLECTIDTVVYTEETLVVYVSSFKKNQIIWQASVQCDMSRSKKNLPDYIMDLVEKLYTEYPKVM